MKRSIIAVTLLASTFAANASIVFDVQAIQAKIEMSQTFTNIVKLTNANGDMSPENYAGQLTLRYTKNLDQLIVDALGKGASCEEITSFTVKYNVEHIGKTINQYALKANPAIVKKNVDNLTSNVAVYTLAQCNNLSGN